MFRKRFLLGVLVPILGALAVVGSGFSVFIFDEANTVSVTGNVKVEAIAEGFKIIPNHTEVQIVFDQSFKHSYMQGGGVHFDYVATSGTSPGDAHKVLFRYSNASKFPQTYKVELTLKTALAAYIVLGAGTTGYEFNETTNNDEKKYTFSLSRQSSNSIFQWSYVSMNYATNMEPKNEAEWNTLNQVDKTMNILYTITK